VPKRRVWEVARDLGVTSKRLVEDLGNQGINVTSSFSMLDEETVELVLRLYREQDAAVVPVPPPIEQNATVTALEAAQPIVAPALPPMQSATPEKALRVTEPLTIKDFAEALQVTTKDVLAQLMSMGTMASINQVIDLDTANVVAQKLGKHVTLVTEGEADAAKDRISGGIMSLSEEPNNTAADLSDGQRETGNTGAEESSESTPSDTGAEETDTSVPIGTAAGESSGSTPSDTGTEEGGQYVVVDLGQARRRQVKRLRRGRGSLMRKVGRLFVELKAESAFSQDTSTLIIIIEAGRQRRG